jgi:uracil-DNA glycosylase
MLLRAMWEFLEEAVFPAETGELLFNQYRTSDERYDLPGAERIRRENLRSYLGSFERMPGVLLVGEAPGPWGCRFSGVNFTSEAQLCSGELPFTGRQSSLREAPYRELSGTVVWKALGDRRRDVLLWNCVPFHPHRRGEPLSIRTPTAAEISAYSGVLREIERMVAPGLVVAVGRSAERALGSLGIPRRYVRHPAQGGAASFRAGVEELLRAHPPAPAG